MAQLSAMLSIVEKFEARLHSDIDKSICYPIGDIALKEWLSEGYHPGLFAAFTYQAAMSGQYISKNVLDYSLFLERFYISSILQDSIFTDMLNGNGQRVVFERLLFQLECGAQGLGGIVKMNQSEVQRSKGAINVIQNLCEAEIKILNEKICMIELLKSRREVGCNYSRYVESVSSSIPGFAMAIGNYLAGKRYNNALKQSGVSFATAYDIWKSRLQISRLLDGKVDVISVFDAMPIIMWTDYGNIPDLTDCGAFCRSKIISKTGIEKILKRADLLAQAYYRKGVASFRRVYGEDDYHLLTYFEFLKNRMRKVERQ